MRTVAVLFARSDSIYKTMEGCDVWDEARDATAWLGGSPIVAHPPCGPWGRLYKFCKKPEQKALAIWAVKQVRKWGGVLEHHSTSRLFSASALDGEEPIRRDGSMDSFGGFTMTVPQWWWGHRAEKMTTLYIVGCAVTDLPEVPIKLGEASAVVRYSKNTWRDRHTRPIIKPEITKREREQTPPRFAAWLVETARLCQPSTAPTEPSDSARERSSTCPPTESSPSLNTSTKAP